MKQCCEYLRGLRYKLRMMGIPCEGPAYIHGDNQSVLASCGIPDSILKKKSQSIAYHFMREGAARDEWRTLYVNTSDNEANLLTKLLVSGEQRKGFAARLLQMLEGYYCTISSKPDAQEYMRMRGLGIEDLNSQFFFWMFFLHFGSGWVQYQPLIGEEVTTTSDPS